MDGDIVAYRTAAAIETKIDWGDAVKTRQANFDDAKREVTRWLKQLKEDLSADALIVAMSDPSGRYFRHDIYPEYKAHRTHGEKPLLLKDTKQFLADCEGFRPFSRPMLEADDVLGILGTHPTIVGGEKIVVTADKDLLQVPGKHYNPRHPERGIVTQDAAAADRFFYQQALTGDPTDGFPGCPGIGPKKAGKLLDEAYQAAEALQNLMTTEEAVWHYITSKYQSKGKTIDYALTQARVARILRWEDYDYTNKRPILWEPKVSEAGSLQPV